MKKHEKKHILTFDYHYLMYSQCNPIHSEFPTAFIPFFCPKAAERMAPVFLSSQGYPGRAPANV